MKRLFIAAALIAVLGLVWWGVQDAVRGNETRYVTAPVERAKGMGLVGAATPLLFARLHIDPAVATGPFVTTTIDVLGVLVYFNLADFLI